MVKGRHCEIDGGCVVAQTEDAVHLKVDVSPSYLFGRFCELLHYDHEVTNFQHVLGHEASNAIILITTIYLGKRAVILV